MQVQQAQDDRRLHVAAIPRGVSRYGSDVFSLGTTVRALSSLEFGRP